MHWTVFDVNRSLSLSDIIPESKLRARPPSISDGVETSSNNAKRTQHLSETSDCGSTDSSGCDFFSDECDVLQEMFPESSFLEVKHCVTIANGDIDRATQILLDRQEAGQSLTANFTNLHAPKNQVIDDNELKNRIISRWVYHCWKFLNLLQASTLSVFRMIEYTQAQFHLVYWTKN